MMSMRRIRAMLCLAALAAVMLPASCASRVAGTFETVGQYPPETSVEVPEPVINAPD